MPRDGSGHSDNAIEAGHNIVHGADGSNAPDSSIVDRANKTAPAPEIEKGAALEGMNASGGGSTGVTGAKPESENVEGAAK